MNLRVSLNQRCVNAVLALLEEFLLAFSLMTNYEVICDRRVGSDTIPCIHGIRAYSMGWIILSHLTLIGFKFSDNMELRGHLEKQFLTQTVINGSYGVDTFFFISGFLVSFIYFRTDAKGKLEKLSKGFNEFTAGALHFASLLTYRFLRLTAPYLFVIGLVELQMKYIASNSVFEAALKEHVNCAKYWWRNVLYINTLFPIQDMCMSWSWYLANDTQFYIIGAIVLIVAIRHFRFAATTFAIFMVAAWLTTGLLQFFFAFRTALLCFCLKSYFGQESLRTPTTTFPTRTIRWPISMRSTTSPGRGWGRIWWECRSDTFCLKPTSKSNSRE